MFVRSLAADVKKIYIPPTSSAPSEASIDYLHLLLECKHLRTVCFLFLKNALLREEERENSAF